METIIKSFSCENGNRQGNKCPMNTYNSNTVELKLFKECTDLELLDITSHLKSLCSNGKSDWTVVNSKLIEAKPLR